MRSDNSKIEHKIYIEGKLIKTFYNLDYYDTNNPYQWCLKELMELKDKIVKGHSLTIKSLNEIYVINNLKDFRAWVEHKSNLELEKYIFEKENFN